MASSGRNFTVDICAWPSARRVLCSPRFPYFFQFVALLVLAFLIVNGFLTGSPESYGGNLASLIRKTNLTTLIVWGLWWPGLILATIVLGRVWCTVCPMELIANLANRSSRALHIRGLTLPDWMQRGFLVLGSYVLLQLLVAGFQVHRIPLYTSHVLLSLAILAMSVGFLFKEPRAFCKGFCPAAQLLNIYARLSPVSIGKRADHECLECDTRDCVNPEYRYRFDARSCPSFLRPFEAKADDACVFCFQCLKVCPKGNIRFGISQSGPKIGASYSLPLASALFVFVASGFVSHELFAEVPGLDKVFHTLPTWLANLSGYPKLFPWFEALWFLGVLPTIVFGLMWVTHLFSNRHEAVKVFIARVGLFLVPVLAAGHAIKAILKMNAWSVYLPGALFDPVGVVAARRVLAGSAPESRPLFPELLIAPLILAVLGVSLVLALRLIRDRLEASSQRAAYAGVGALTCVYLVVLLKLFVSSGP